MQAASNQPITIATLIEQLATAQTRDLAAHDLAAHGRAAEPQLRRALARAQTPELRAELEEILKGLPETLTRDRAMIDRPAYQSWKFGRYTASSVHAVVGLPDGGTILYADRVLDASGKPAVALPANADPKAAANPWEHAPATLLQEPGGEVHLLGEVGSPLVMGGRVLKNGQYESVVALPVDSGRPLWTLGDGRGMPPQLIDVASGRVLGRLPLPGILSVDAVAADGTMFLAGQHQMVAYRPPGKDTRRHVEPIAQTAAASSRELAECFKADGCYWFSEPVGDSGKDRIIVRFNGKTIDTYPASRLSLANPFDTIKMAPGRDGVLVEANKSWMLVTPRGVHQVPVLEDLIAQNASEVAVTFASPRWLRSGEQPTHVVADGAGNIWLVRRPSGEIKVLTGGVWLDVSETLKKAGDPRGMAALCVPLGDSPKVLVVDGDHWNTPDAIRGKTTYIVSVAGKSLTAERVADVSNPGYNAEFPWDAMGDPWVNAFRDPQMYSSLTACRMTAKGPVDWIDHAGVLTGDGTDCVWVSFRPPSAEHAEVRLYRDGRFIPPALPLGISMSPLWTTANGQLCHSSLLGLHVIKTSQQSGKLTWEAPQTLCLEPTEAAPEAVGVSSRGFAVAHARLNRGPGIANTFFYSLNR